MKQALVKGFAFFVLVAAVLLLSNTIYSKWFYRQDIIDSDAAMLIEINRLQGTSDVIYFSESSNYTTLPTDSSAKWISQFLADEIPGIRVDAIQHGAIHAATYLSLLENIRPGAKTKTIIITMNLRSFGPVWINSNLETPLMKANVMYTSYPPIIKRMMLAFNGFDNRDESLRRYETEKHWRHDKMNLPADFPYQNVRVWDDSTAKSKRFLRPDGSFDSTKMQLACNYIKVYGFSIDPETNPRIADFDAIVKLAKQKHLNLVFNLLSENTQYADSLVGKELSALIRDNRDLLMKRYNKDGVIVVDNLELVYGKEFIDQDGVTEHYNMWGRLRVAKNIARVAGKFFRREIYSI